MGDVESEDDTDGDEAKEDGHEDERADVLVGEPLDLLGDEELDVVGDTLDHPSQIVGILQEAEEVLDDHFDVPGKLHLLPDIVLSFVEAVLFIEVVISLSYVGEEVDSLVEVLPAKDVKLEEVLELVPVEAAGSVLHAEDAGLAGILDRPQQVLVTEEQSWESANIRSKVTNWLQLVNLPV